jgi:pre-mRNA-splicing factor ATP-dependent RNA helicase DHX15/PRP43
MNKNYDLDVNGVHLNPLNSQPYSDTYLSLAKIWSEYPAYGARKEIINSIKNNQVTFIISGTGSGKTVLIPKFALIETEYKGKIGIVLPKRLVTLSAAQFAATTLDITLGNEIGYIYKGSPKEMINMETNKMIYMTDGTLIVQIIKDPLLSQYNTIIIDEAHERKIQIDLILMLLKRILTSGKRPDLKVIIMSATIDADKYKQYFNNISSNIINIAGKPNKPIDIHYANNLSASSTYSDVIKHGFKISDDIIKNTKKGDIIFFITTSSETHTLCNEITSKYNDVLCLEVFGDMPSDQKIYLTDLEKFKQLEKYTRRLLMATNVAESSLTVDGLEYVIDSGYELYSYFDPSYGAHMLEKRLITKAQATQRRGRVGRTAPGTCYNLYSESTFQNMKDFPDPDILKQDITMDMIKILMLPGIQSTSKMIDTLNQLLDPPKKSYINYGVNLLKLYNIIDNNDQMTVNAIYVSNFTTLELNRIIFLVKSFALYCGYEASIILGMLDAINSNMGNLFVKNMKNKSTNKNFINMADSSGDHITLLKLYNKFFDIKDKDAQKKFADSMALRKNLFFDAKTASQHYFNKILNLKKQKFDEADDTTIGGDNRNRLFSETKKLLLSALKLSHEHLIVNKLQFIASGTKGHINRDSTLSKSSSKFICDEFVGIEGQFQFNICTKII